MPRSTLSFACYRPRWSPLRLPVSLFRLRSRRNYSHGAIFHGTICLLRACCAREILVLVVCASAAGGLSATVAEGQAYLEACRRGAYDRAIEVADRLHRADPQEGLYHLYLGMARAHLGEQRSAVDAFAMADLVTRPALPDRRALLARAQCLIQLQAYNRGRQVLDELVRRYPHSPLASRDHRLALQIDERMQRGDISADHSNWYQDRALQARDDGLHGLAIEYLREARILAELAAPTSGVQIRLLLATWLLGLDRPDRALVEVEELPIESRDYQIAWIQSVCLRELGRQRRAHELLTIIAERANSARLRQRARALLERASSPIRP